jgi:hypothetical protein
MLDRMKSGARRLFRMDRPRRPRQPRLLDRGPSPDPRRAQPSADPNARFIGEQMRGGREG